MSIKLPRTLQPARLIMHVIVLGKKWWLRSHGEMMNAEPKWLPRRAILEEIQ